MLQSVEGKTLEDTRETFPPGHPAAFEVHAGVHARRAGRLREGGGVGHPPCLGRTTFSKLIVSVG